MPLHIIRNDITTMCVDAIVNTTNQDMIGYSGVDLAVHKLAGKQMDEECAKIAPQTIGTDRPIHKLLLFLRYTLQPQIPYPTTANVFFNGIQHSIQLFKTH